MAGRNGVATPASSPGESGLSSSTAALWAGPRPASRSGNASGPWVSPASRMLAAPPPDPSAATIARRAVLLPTLPATATTSGRCRSRTRRAHDRSTRRNVAGQYHGNVAGARSPHVRQARRSRRARTLLRRGRGRRSAPSECRRTGRRAAPFASRPRARRTAEP